MEYGGLTTQPKAKGTITRHCQYTHFQWWTKIHWKQK